ncbi:MAG: GMC family oxidoreductase [Saprospiraceae bacterium]|nr:GMC family oxidoreductase [Saprospiraceae bacterium]
MSNFQIKKKPTVYDAIIVGSGAGGGMAGYVLSQAGLKVLMLEAGPFYDPKLHSFQMLPPWASLRRGAGTTRPFGEFDAAMGGWQIDGEPYTAAEGTEFHWFRSHMLGGRTNHWGRISLRFGPNDFKGKSYDGVGDDWPISYDDVKPYYDKIDVMLGIYGTKEGLPNDPDGIFMKPPKPRLHEILIKKAGQKIGVPVIPGRGSVLTEDLKDPNSGRQKCWYCGQCGRACKIYGDFSSSSCLVIPAQTKYSLELECNAMVREVLTDQNGQATGVSYVSKDDGQEYQVMGKTVILAASACSTARIMLNSKSSRHPNGIGNGSGAVGKYLHDSTGVAMGGIMPSLLDRKRYNEDGVGSVHILSPWWLDNKKAKLDFPRGYHIEYWGGMGDPAYGFGFGIQGINGKYPTKDGQTKEAGGYGASLKQDYRRFFGANVGMAGRGVGLALESNYCEIDPNKVDKWGIPVLRFHYKWTDAEINQAKHMQETFQEMMKAMGADITWGIQGKENTYGLEAPGRIIHEVGTVRMGDDPKKAPLNKWCQSHEVKNLFVTDGGPIVQQGDKNCTWTILALAMRTGEYIVEQKKQNNI